MTSQLTRALRNQVDLKPQDEVQSRLQQDYTEIKVIGKGGFGVVMLARHRLDGQLYAIKKVRDTFINETKVHAQLDHPNIARYHCSWVETVSAVEQFLLNDLRDLDLIKSPDNFDNITFSPSDLSRSAPAVEVPQTNQIRRRVLTQESAPVSRQASGFGSHLYIQMQFIDGVSYKSLMDKDSQLNIYKQVVQAVEYMHSKQLVHGDIQPDNVLIKDSKAYLIDFGHSFHQDQSVTKLRGAHSYLSPEKTRSQQADVYALGIILMEIKFPFKTRMERAHAINSLRQGSKPWFDDPVICSMLRYDPQSRITTHQLLSQLSNVQRSTSPGLVSSPQNEEPVMFLNFEESTTDPLKK